MFAESTKLCAAVSDAIQLKCCKRALVGVVLANFSVLLVLCISSK